MHRSPLALDWVPAALAGAPAAARRVGTIERTRPAAPVRWLGLVVRAQASVEKLLDLGDKWVLRLDGQEPRNLAEVLQLLVSCPEQRVLQKGVVERGAMAWVPSLLGGGGSSGRRRRTAETPIGDLAALADPCSRDAARHAPPRASVPE